MRTPSSCARSGILAFAVALATASLAPPPNARAQTGDGAGADAPAPQTSVAPATLPVELEQTREALAQNVRMRLREAGVAVRAERALRARLAALPATPAPSSCALVVAASADGPGPVVLADLRRTERGIDVALRVYAPGGCVLTSAARSAGSAERLGPALDAAVARILPALGGSAELLSPASLSIDQLAAESRALAALEKRELALAWRALEGVDSALARSLRTRIDVLAAERETPPAERVRLALARSQEAPNDPAARQTLMDAARAIEGEPTPARVLLAAGELRLSRSETEDARLYLERAIALEPRNAEAHLAHGRALALLGNDGEARQSFERAASLDLQSSRALEELAQLEASEPVRQAEVLMRAGERAAQALETRASQADFARALALDPGLAPGAREREAELYTRLGDPARARASWQQAIDAGGVTPARVIGVARASFALADAQSAETAFRSALELDPKSAPASLGLGTLYTEMGRDAEARPLLERAADLAPRQAEPKLALALVLHRSGEPDAALSLLRSAEIASRATSEGLRLQATILRERGDAAGARASLERAVELDPIDADLRGELAAAHELLGDPGAAELERRNATLLAAGSIAAPEAPARAAETARTSREPRDSGPVDEHLAELLQSFAAVTLDAGRVALVGVSEPLDRRESLLDWVRPRIPDHAALDRALANAIGAQYDLIPRKDLASALANLADRERVDALLRFERRASLDATTVAEANVALDSDALFLARVERAPRRADDGSAICGGETPWRLELRQLSGRNPVATRILANALCLSDKGDYARWNPRAMALAGLFAAYLLFQIVRGWGSVHVSVDLPPSTRALFSISLSRRPRKPRATKSMKSRAKAKSRIEEGLMRLNRYERPLREGRPALFTWIPARWRPIYVTVRGPLFNTATNELIGDFLEEQVVRVRRGKKLAVKFDLRPKETVVEVSVVGGEKPAGPAAIALKGLPASLRYANEGGVFLYLKQGQYTLLVGVGDRLLERMFEIRSFENVKLAIDLARSQEWVFTGSAEAVTAYMEGDFARAADALERAGNAKAASKIRGQLLRAKGDLGGAARAVERGGDLRAAAELRAASEDRGGAAALFEAAGDFEQAADAYRASGDFAAAARAYERAGDFALAIECAKELGDEEVLLALYEKNGDAFEAGELALKSRQPVRAIHAFSQVDRIDANYRAACRRLVELKTERGQLQPALEKLEELVLLEGGDDAPLQLLSVQARLLEKLGRGEEALVIWEAIEARDASFPSAASRASELRATHRAPEPEPASATPVRASTPESQESRYEILEELGRGAMGVVYKARDTRLGRTVALKRLTDSLRGHTTAIAYFEREARSAAALSHPNIVVVYDAGQENGQYFITMEHLQGTTLEQILKARGAMSAPIVASLGLQICAGLHYAHTHKIIHRDIKTSNLFFTRERVVKIMDFGLAKMVEEVRKGATMISGTPYYMAPEQALGENVDHRADLYALGVTFFNLLSNGFPFESGDVTFHHRSTPAPDVRERVASVPAAMAELVAKLMAKRPDARCQSAAEVAQALQAIAASSARAKSA